MSGPPHIQFRWILTSGFCLKYGPVFRRHLLAQMSAHLHVLFAAQVLLNLLGVQPTRHNDEVVTVNEARPHHSDKTTDGDDASELMFTSRIAFSTSSYHADAACLVAYIALTKHPHALPPSVCHLAPPRKCLAWPGRRSTLCVCPHVS